MRLVIACYLAPWWRSLLLDQIAYNNSESLNVTALPHIKIQCSLTNISRGIMVRGFQDCHFGSHVSYKHIMIYASLYLHVALMTPYNPAYGSDEMLFEREL